MQKLSTKEKQFLKSRELCRLATASRDGAPHVVPVIYAIDGDDVVIVTDYGTKKLKNLKENPRASLVVDEYHPNRGVVIFGNVELYEKGKEYLRLLKILFDRFEYYRKNPWKEGEAPILKITPSKVISWNLPAIK
jgi:PPOX class probable F420-dependent enzyme